jgi:hypothetical protein
MQVLCKGTQFEADFHCEVCGQGFALFWERATREERAQAIQEIQETMRRHHLASPAADAHPQSGFLVPEWNGPIAFSGAAILGNAPAWAL